MLEVAHVLALSNHVRLAGSTGRREVEKQQGTTVVFMLSKGAATQAYSRQCDAPVTCWGGKPRAKEHCHLERDIGGERMQGIPSILEEKQEKQETWW